MKGIIRHNKVTLGILGFSFALYAFISVFSKPLTTPEDTPLKKITVPTEGRGIEKFDMKMTAKASTNTSKVLNYSLSFPSSVVRESKYDGRTTNFYYNGSRVASLTFVYNDKNAYTPLSYAKDVLGRRLPVAIDTKEVTIGQYSFITVSAEESYFRITSVKNGTWLASLEMLEGNQDLEKMILDTLSVK